MLGPALVQQPLDGTLAQLQRIDLFSGQFPLFELLQQFALGGSAFQRLQRGLLARTGQTQITDFLRRGIGTLAQRHRQGLGQHLPLAAEIVSGGPEGQLVQRRWQQWRAVQHLIYWLELFGLEFALITQACHQAYELLAAKGHAHPHSRLEWPGASFGHQVTEVLPHGNGKGNFYKLRHSQSFRK